MSGAVTRTEDDVVHPRFHDLDAVGARRRDLAPHALERARLELEGDGLGDHDVAALRRNGHVEALGLVAAGLGRRGDRQRSKDRQYAEDVT